MALNLDAVGKKIGPITKEYTWKDAVLYALGVGAGFSDLEYCYEKDLKVIPSFSITTIYDTMPEALALTDVNLAGILHGEQELLFHNPIPPEGKRAPSLTSSTKVKGKALWSSPRVRLPTRAASSSLRPEALSSHASMVALVVKIPLPNPFRFRIEILTSPSTHHLLKPSH